MASEEEEGMGQGEEGRGRVVERDGAWEGRLREGA